ncbi:hypothetical protein ILUMI_07771 [Ignelater luminosus]|uniref:Uncharacterized protein n=1 Tax=Ignelater luminosus TaxID=2038154 RepID=A0A8K0D2W4_IGNLU|nr:hypothetical protein ILUMI_07771 [Ignelater luminosus]
MKLIAVLFFALLAYLQASDHYWSSEELDCIKELKLQNDKVGAISQPWGKPIATNNKALNDYFVCYWQKVGMLGNDGKIKWNKFKTHITNELINITVKEETNLDTKLHLGIVTYVGQIVKDSLEKCHKQNILGNTPGQTIDKVLNCLGNETREKLKTL